MRRTSMLTTFSIFCIFTVITSCSNIPSELKSISEKYLDEARRLAEEASKSCPDLMENHGKKRFNSPARNTELSHSDDVLQVTVTCFDHGGTGVPFPPLNPPYSVDERTFLGGPYMFSNKKYNREFLRKGSFLAENGLDLVVERPTDNGWVEVIVVLKDPRK